MIASRIDLWTLQEIVIASALPKPIPALAAVEAVGEVVFAAGSVMSTSLAIPHSNGPAIPNQRATPNTTAIPLMSPAGSKVTTTAKRRPSVKVNVPNCSD